MGPAEGWKAWALREAWEACTLRKAWILREAWKTWTLRKVWTLPEAWKAREAPDAVS
ncbi:hypothetical protein [Streptomyces sp. NPDC003077]|uniref:hypothetical protein n=1 Tax=Streptomyces sp. NPDC003077 TaxID=3154443 RepID=UPI00339FC1C9